MKILYINRFDRPDRDAKMKAQLDRLLLPYERIEATMFKEAGGFQNCAFRGNFFDHVRLMERIAVEKQPYVIFEDDTVIQNEFYDPVWRMEMALAMISKFPDWCFLHFYKETAVQQQKMLMQRMNSLAMNAYTINLRKADVICQTLKKAYESIYAGPKLLWQGAIDQYCRLNVWPRFPAYGIDNTCLQGDMGSDTGWREHKVED